MMTTNALSIVFLNAAISWLFTTNTAEHWPKVWKWEPVEHTEYLNVIPGLTYQPGPGGMLQPGLQQWRDDTNADTMSIETSITRQRLLSFEFEKRKFSEVLTNEPWMHYSVDMQRVRTNVWNRINAFHLPEGLQAVAEREHLMYGLLATNYFVPVKTNSLPLFALENQPWMHGYTVTNGIGTNMFYILNNVITNYTVLWATTNATNTIK